MLYPKPGSQRHQYQLLLQTPNLGILGLQTRIRHLGILGLVQVRGGPKAKAKEKTRVEEKETTALSKEVSSSNRKAGAYSSSNSSSREIKEKVAKAKVQEKCEARATTWH